MKIICYRRFLRFEVTLNKGSYKSNRKKFEKAILNLADVRMERVVIQMTNYIKESFPGSSSRGTYDARGRYHRKKNINRSSPGQPPFVQTGRLKDNVIYAKSKSSYLIGVRRVVDYAYVLEVGGATGRGGYIKPRPYLRPSIMWARNNFNRLFK